MVSGHVKTQLIAHDKEVYDIAFSKAGGGRDMFASVGADGRFENYRFDTLLAAVKVSPEDQYPLKANSLILSVFECSTFGT